MKLRIRSGGTWDDTRVELEDGTPIEGIVSISIDPIRRRSIIMAHIQVELSYLDLVVHSDDQFEVKTIDTHMKGPK